ncbi:MAG: FlgD immunoglobulin-like domain containing protein [Deltaproteobacteria bacterium]|nr:FlgD immunoglobulin-like domain containing protein [Deltaproteobacteria bacterium]
MKHPGPVTRGSLLVVGLALLTAILVEVTGVPPAMSAPLRKPLVAGSFEARREVAGTPRLQLVWRGTTLADVELKSVELGPSGRLTPVIAPEGPLLAGEPLEFFVSCDEPESDFTRLVLRFSGASAAGFPLESSVSQYLDLRGGQPRPATPEQYLAWYRETTGDPEPIRVDGVVEPADGKSTFQVTVVKTTYDRLPFDDTVSERRLPRAKIEISTRPVDSSSWTTRSVGDLQADGSYATGAWDQSFPCVVRIMMFTTSNTSANRHVVVESESGSPYWVTFETGQIDSGSMLVLSELNIDREIGPELIWQAFAIQGAAQDAWSYFHAETSTSLSTVNVTFPIGTWPLYNCPSNIALPLSTYYEVTREPIHHEYGHHVQCRTYGSLTSCSFTQPIGCGSVPSDFHWPSMASCPEFAFTEGWAEFVSCAIDSRPANQADPCYGNGDIETNSFYMNDGIAGDGCVTEGSLASILWDAMDSGGETQDALSLGIDRLFNDVIERFEPTNADELAAALIAESENAAATQQVFAHYGCSPDPMVTITAIAGPHGAISPSGGVNVLRGADASFTITPDTGYEVATLVVDDTNLAPATSYTFNNVTADHTISVTFAAVSHTIVAAAGANGSIAPSGTVSVADGSDQVFVMTPDPGYGIASLTIDGASMPAQPTYVFDNVTADHTISVSFALATSFVLLWTASPVDGGQVSVVPESAAYEPGTTVQLTAIPATGYTWSGWSGDTGGVNTNPLNVVMNSDRTITANFQSDVPALPYGDTVVFAIDLSSIGAGDSPLFSLQIVVGTGDVARATGILGTPYPNPFNPTITIPYSPIDGANLKLAIYDVAGRMVRLLLSEVKSPGTYRLTWDGRDERGECVASGVYFVKLEHRGEAEVERVVLVK